LWDSGFAYAVAAPDAVPAADGTRGDDIYFDIAAAERVTSWRLGDESALARADMLPLFTERGGDPDRAGKRDPLDPLLWRAARPYEPAWPAAVGTGRPGWHIECSVIALTELGAGFTVQGGGSDLIFPHHDMSGGHAAALSGTRLAEVYCHAGMVSYQGEKMSKSLGNLVLISDLLDDGADPRAIRLAILQHHYRSDWEWTASEADAAHRRLAAWRSAFGEGSPAGTASAQQTISRIREALTRDLDTPAALAIVDAAAASRVDAPHTVARAVEALLGIRLAD
jgi:L-cysteine:1D-myo-inositol 2-amino-2-deoxy-alpha-D-glucopyranoside ligase